MLFIKVYSVLYLDLKSSALFKMKDEKDKFEYPDVKKPVVLLKIKMKGLHVQLFASVMRMSMSPAY